MITAGIDCGAGNTKIVILKDGDIIARAMVPTGFEPVEAVEKSLGQALVAGGIKRDDVREIAGIGSGRDAVRISGRKVDHEQAMGKGARHFFSKARTVVDVGAEEGRAAKLDERGGTEDVVVNERCAAGAGVFIETMSRILEVPVEEMGPLALTSNQSIPMNAQCAVFAESEAVGLIHAGVRKEDISRAVHEALAGRIISMIRRIGVNEDLVMIGGVARNPGVVEIMKRELKLENIHIPEDPEYTAAVGAAVLAAEEV